MNREAVINEMLRIAEELTAMDFSTQKQMDDYLKAHPDADKSKHKVVKHDKSDMSTHPFNLMRQRQNEKAMGDIARWHKKEVKDLTVDDITKYNQRGKKSGQELVAKELLAIARELAGGAKEYHWTTGIGKSKYVVNFHNGTSTHKDGSDFYDMKIFRNRPDMEAFISELVKKGYKEGKPSIYK